MVIFNSAQHAELLASANKYVEIVATGKEIEVGEDYYKKEVILKAHKTKPVEADYYIMEVSDPELKEMATDNDTDIFYIEYV